MNKNYRFKWNERQTAIAKRKVNIDLNDAGFALNLKNGYILTSPIRVDLEGFSKTPFCEVVIRYCNGKYISALRQHVRHAEYLEKNDTRVIRLNHKIIEDCQKMARLLNLNDDGSDICKVIELAVGDYVNQRLV